MGKGPIESILDFGAQNRIFMVHFRNVDQPLPHFVETFVDDGYMDMFEIMQALKEVEFNGIVIADHIPSMGDDPRFGTAYTIGYVKSMLDQLNR